VFEIILFISSLVLVGLIGYCVGIRNNEVNSKLSTQNKALRKAYTQQAYKLTAIARTSHKLERVCANKDEELTKLHQRCIDYQIILGKITLQGVKNV